jgi:hypothetical protein
MARNVPGGGGRKKINDYLLPMPKSGWRGGGARSPNEGPVVNPNRRHRRGKRYSPRSRPT